MNFIISTDTKEIEQVINKSHNQAESIIWQTASDKRTIYQIQQIHIDQLRKILRFKIEKSENALQPELTVYVKLAFRSAIFKGHVIGKKDEFIFLAIPEEVQFENMREFPRFQFSLDEERSATMSIKTQLIANSMFNLKVRLLDISQTGLAMLITNANKELFRDNELYLTSLGNMQLEQYIQTQIVHAKKFNYKIQDQKLVGIKIGTHLKNRIIDLNVLENFIRSSEGFDHSQIGFLGHDDNFKNILHYQMAQLQKQLTMNNNLFQYLGSAVESATKLKEHEYFPRHIKVLAQLSCGIAKLMGLDNKKVIELLIYAAFVHDIAFYANPKLALIKNTDHFHLARSSLSLEEQNTFKMAPKIAFDYAFYDKYAPKGAENILIQARELPDGTGFPNNLRANNIHPLSAIFIIAHDLTDYILEHKSWNYYDYLLISQQKFRGGVFDEIFSLLEQKRKLAY